MGWEGMVLAAGTVLVVVGLIVAGQKGAEKLGAAKQKAKGDEAERETAHDVAAALGLPMSDADFIRSARRRLRRRKAEVLGDPPAAGDE